MQTNIVGILIVIVVVLIILALLYWFFGRKKPEVYYFLPGEVIFKIRHSPTAIPRDAEQIKADIVTAIGGFLNPDENSSQQRSVNGTQSTDRNWRNRLALPDSISKVITFPFTNERGLRFSLVRVPVKGYDPEKDMDTKAVTSILREAYTELKQNDSLLMPNGYSIEDLYLNWLIGNLHHGGATGGPGGRPTQASTPKGGAQVFRIFDGAMQLLPNPPAALPGTNVFVAILDTAPSSAAIANAYHTWPAHQLVQELFSANGRLTIHRASQTTLNDLEHFSPVLHDYMMPDHGTFISGIIYDNAPGATLHLYEVLSRYGVGTFTSIAQGILDVLNNPNIGRPLIINCSFMFCLPGGDYGPNLEADLGVDISTSIKAMRTVFEDIVDPDITVVASAGNDSSGQTQRVPARYPAAFNNVIGVGALRKGNSQNTTSINIPASYSNIADNPPGNGFVTLGGEPGTGQGIRGMYISSFPGLFGINQTGWAWWSGTSFATAIISGFLAARWSGPLQGQVLNFAAARAELNNHVQPNQFRTADGESVIHVEQG
jgi:hypothetical protein